MHVASLALPTDVEAGSVYHSNILAINMHYITLASKLFFILLHALEQLSSISGVNDQVMMVGAVT